MKLSHNQSLLLSAGAGILYGLSWPIIPNVSLPFLAWFAFSILFYTISHSRESLMQVQQIISFAVPASVISMYGVFRCPYGQATMLMVCIHETILTYIPFLLIPLFRRWFSSKQSIGLVLFLSPLWELAYLHMPTTFAHSMIYNSQADCLWLIQMVDLFGASVLTFWVLLVNYIIFLLITERHWKRSACILSFLFLFPLLYSTVHKHQLKSEEALTVGLVQGNRAVFDIEHTLVVRDLHRMIHITDSMVNHASQNSIDLDLIVWPESALDQGRSLINTDSLLFELWSRWQVPMVVGAVDTPSEDDSMQWRQNTMIYYDGKVKSVHQKVKRTPGYEMHPLECFSGINIDRRMYIEPSSFIQLHSMDSLQFGSPICFEQAFPGLWQRMSAQGADFFVLGSYDAWFNSTSTDFVKQLMNCSRLRAVEQRRTVVRCGDGGYSGFIDASGRVYGLLEEGRDGFSIETLAIYNDTTIFSKCPWLAYLLYIFGFIFSVILFMKRKSAISRGDRAFSCKQ